MSGATREKSGSKRKKKVLALVTRRFPIIDWVRNYTKEDAISDLIAGITLGLTMIPQSIAYASLAGLTPQDGLNSAFIGLLVYACFGTIKEVVIGPTSLMALLTFEYTHNLSADFVVLLGFLCGIVELIMGFLHLGCLVELFSAPVVSGFTTATSLIIVVSQLKGLIGVNFKSKGIMDNIIKLYKYFPKMRLGDTTLGITCIIFLLCLRKLRDVNVPEKVPHRGAIKKCLWFLSTGRNALAVLLASLIAYHYKSSGQGVPFVTTRSSDTSIPSFRFPPMSTNLNNRTYTLTEMVSELGAGYIVIPVVSVLANVAIAKSFVNGAVDATQEMLALSLCNILGSMFQSMPTTGAFTRSAVSSASGIRTPLAGLYSAAMTLMALGFLGSYFHYIPKAALSAVLVAAVIFLVDWQIVRILWKKSWLDLFTVICTFVVCLFVGVEIGLILGIGIGLIYLIYKWARPQVLIQKRKTATGDVVIVRPNGGFFFPALDYLSALIQKAGRIEGQSKDPVYVDCSSFSGTDYSVAKGIMSLEAVFEKRGQKLRFFNVPPDCFALWTGTGCNKEYLSSIDNSISPVGEEIKVLPPLQEDDEKLAEQEALLKTQSEDSPV